MIIIILHVLLVHTYIHHYLIIAHSPFFLRSLFKFNIKINSYLTKKLNLFENSMLHKH